MGPLKDHGPHTRNVWRHRREAVVVAGVSNWDWLQQQTRPPWLVAIRQGNGLASSV